VVLINSLSFQHLMMLVMDSFWMTLVCLELKYLSVGKEAEAKERSYQ